MRLAPVWKLSGFVMVSLLYISFVVMCNVSALRLHIGTGELIHSSEAWYTDAIPWVIACLLAVGLSLYVRLFRQRVLQVALLTLLSIAVTTWLVMQPVAYSMDILRYLWDGRLLVHRVNPYLYVPADSHLSSFHQWINWSVMDWKEWPEAYPPLAQDYFGLIAYLTNGTILQYKGMLLVNAFASIFLFYLVLIERKRMGQGEGLSSLPDGTSHKLSWKKKFSLGTQTLSDRDIQHFGVFVLFPPLLMESYSAGHVDAFAIPWLLLALLFRYRRHPGRMGAAIAMATAIKVYPVVLFAALWNTRDPRGIIKSLITFAVTMIILYAPYLSAGRAIFSFFGHVAQMDYNGSIEYLLAKGFGHIVDTHSTLLVFVLEVAAWYVMLFTKARKLPIETKICLLGLTFVLASPVVHPWYLLSLLPFAIMADEASTLWLSVSVHFAYDEVMWDMFIEYIPTYYMFLLRFRSAWTHKRATGAHLEGVVSKGEK